MINKELFLKKIDELKQTSTANQPAIEAIQNWILQSQPLERNRINPFAISSYSGLGMGVIVPQLLYGITTGLFDLHWDVHCSHCDMLSSQFNNLSEATGLYHCNMCEIDFESNFSERVEITFALNKEIEDLNIPPMCSPIPALNPRFQMSVLQGQTASSEEILEAGVYKYNCPITQTTGTLIVSGEKAEETQTFKINQLENQRFDPDKIYACPGKIRIELTNKDYPVAGLWLADNDLPILAAENLPIRLSGLELIHFPEFREIFGSQVISDRERIKISSVTTMFTDITGSTQMYDKLGDTTAYNIVRDHFDIMFEAIEKNGGKVLKTIGDAVMASFTRNKQALKTIVTVLRRFDLYNQNREADEHVHIKIGLHRGPAILVNLNGRLDYFGASINKAARIQSLSGISEISFSEAVFADDDFMTAIKEAGINQPIKETVNLKGIEKEQIIYKIAI